MGFLAYDLGTSGVKASLYDDAMQTLAKTFVEYQTFYPAPGLHEQRPEDWWDAVITATQALLEKTGVAPKTIRCVALSGHSLVAVPMGRDGKALLDAVPIWSDTRAVSQAEAFFKKVDEDEWYLTTGNGFPPACYSVFKLIWLKEKNPDLFSKIDKVLGSKDYINYKMTGEMATDHSYASGTGGYDLKENRMKEAFFTAAGLPVELFPQPVASHAIIGGITAEAATQLGLRAGTPVACGGVDNACMALGAVGAVPGRVYTSLGSSSWIPVNSTQPVLEVKKRPYVFAHIEPGLYTSAFSIFAGGSSLKWARETLCPELDGRSDAYQRIDAYAAASPVGANGIYFNPSLAGGTSQDKNMHIRGAFMGLHLGATRADLLRAVMEGVALNLRLSLDALAAQTKPEGSMLLCGGGSKSIFWMQLFADIFEMQMIKSNIDQDAASLGAAAIAARAVGHWKDYSGIHALHHIERRCDPAPMAVAQYQKHLPAFRYLCELAADFGAFCNKNKND